jgi:hypothetical protein
LANKERESRQRPAVAVAGWDIAPTFDRDNARLEWAIKAETQGRSIINHYITTLGRSGVLKFCLVDQHRLASTTARFRELAANVSFRAGERFSDHVEGDKRAEGGLLSLITGRAQPLPVAASPADSVAAAAATPASHPSSSGVKIELSSDGRRLLLRLFWLLFFSFLALFVGYVFGMLAGVRRHQKALRRRHGVAQPTATRPRAHWLRTAFSLPARAARSVTPSRPSAVRETPAEKEPVSAVLEAGVSALDAHREVVHKHIDGFRYYERLTRDLYRYNS